MAHSRSRSCHHSGVNVIGSRLSSALDYAHRKKDFEGKEGFYFEFKKDKDKPKE